MFRVVTYKNYPLKDKNNLGWPYTGWSKMHMFLLAINSTKHVGTRQNGFCYGSISEYCMW